jgi:geranylgeranyl diphosphate synthase, type I
MKDKSGISSEISKYASMVDDYLGEHISGETAVIWEAARHYIKAGGKRLRPFLVFKACELVNKLTDPRIILPLASSIELIHTFSLVHDDIIDNDEFRRNIPTVHSRWGVPMAIIAGDILLGMAFVAAAETRVSASAKASIMKELGLVSVALCEGQTRDIIFEKTESVSVRDYLEMINLKTASLFRSCSVIAADASGATEEQFMAMTDFGENLGMSFQIADDILGMVGDEKKLGKPVGSDLSRGKKTYPVLLTLELLRDDEKSQFGRLISKSEKTSEDISEAVRMMRDCGAFDRAGKVAVFYMNKAISALGIFPDSDAKRLLEEMAKFAVERES